MIKLSDIGDFLEKHFGKLGSFLGKLFFVQFVVKLISALGIGIYTYNELSEFWEIMRQQFKYQYNSINATVLSLLDIGGFTTGLEILFSGISFIVAWYATSFAISIFTGK